MQPGNHGSALKEVSVGTNKLEAEPTLNHIKGGSNPAFTASVENSGEFEEHNVKVDITVTAEGKQFKASHAIEKAEAGKRTDFAKPFYHFQQYLKRRGIEWALIPWQR